MVGFVFPIGPRRGGRATVRTRSGRVVNQWLVAFTFWDCCSVSRRSQCGGHTAAASILLTSGWCPLQHWGSSLLWALYWHWDLRLSPPCDNFVDASHVNPGLRRPMKMKQIQSHGRFPRSGDARSRYLALAAIHVLMTARPRETTTSAAIRAVGHSAATDAQE